MATVSTPNLTYPSNPPRSPSPQLKGLKKVFSHHRRSSEAKSEDLASARKSVDSLSLDRSPTLSTTRSSPSREDDRRSSHLGSLIPGHHRRQRQRAREAELDAVSHEPVLRGRTPDPQPLPPSGALENINRSTSSLLTDGSENDTPPPLMSRDSHTGFFTTSSPLIKSITLTEGEERYGGDKTIPAARSVEAFPIILEPVEHDRGDLSPKLPQLNFNSTPILPSPILTDRADTLQVDRVPERRGSISRLRAKSPARKIRDVFSRSAKSPRTSPEREKVNPFSASDPGLQDQVRLAGRRLADSPEKSVPAPLKDTSPLSKPVTLSSGQPISILTDLPTPKTPPGSRLATPLTTVTPPTPTDLMRDEIVASPRLIDEADQESSGTEQTSGQTEPSLTHRRVRSGPSHPHHKSKLSTSMTAPLTPTIEEGSRTPTEKVAGGRNFTASSGFFSSWVSAAQNAASSITNLGGPNRSRAGTSNSEPSRPKTAEETEVQKPDPDEGAIANRQLAVETLGSGNLDFSHLGLDTPSEDKSSSSNKPSLTGLTKKSDLQRDEARAKLEDVLAKRAVSVAYGEAGENTPVAEISDPVASLKLLQTNESQKTGTLTPPNGSLFEVEGQPAKRSNSVRSKLGKRRSRGSSVATGQSTVAGANGNGISAVASLMNGARMTGFTPAPKQRNRGFHQQFRSVPEDDNLIEDYSCALQKEILLAGRIYISEGHICFSSNILGWVTTLIISFEEIVSVERENTAMIIPNAIAIQTLHARHTFRSLLSREATFDLMIGIWKHNHPTSFSKSVNGKQLFAEQARHDAEKALGTKAAEDEESDGDGGSDEGSGSDDDEHDDDSAPSLAGSGASITGSEFLEAKTVTRKPSGLNGVLSPANASAPAIVAAPGADAAPASGTATSAPGGSVDFPGPLSHAPTDCTDAATHYDKIIKDETIPAPLGKVYSLLYGPQSGAFLRKYLVDECKCLELVLEDDKKGLTNENKSRQYSYIKPLGGSIGPKQTKCITTENLDFFDLDRSISVTCTTQTPDVPSGSAFSTKTRYCLSWAPGNATRLQMNCTIEWTAKSWLKGPIEKGANDGQQQYSDGLVKAIKAALGRSRGATVSSKGGKPKKKRKGDKKAKSEQSEQTPQRSENWGLLEPLRFILGPVWDLVKPLASLELAVGILSIMVIILWFSGTRGRGGGLGYPGTALDRIERLAAYEQLWHKEESNLWEWLEDRTGVSQVLLGGTAGGTPADRGKKAAKTHRQRILKDKSMAARLQAEKWSRKEMQEAVRVTRERLDEMQRVLEGKDV